ncbi:FAD-binding domain-containing protein [Acephala macrosclerotiorum]|nr:FAD-binding domain-containing protein [Acephala macrosclerotiorum]
MEILNTLMAWATGTMTGYALSMSSDYSSSAGIHAELSPRLSQNASIILPGSSQFVNATLRWQEWRDPNITVVVEVATESDVQETIKYANAHDIDFLAMSGGHGAIYSLGDMHHGIEIWMHKLSSISISASGDTAIIGGGVLQKDLVDYLWAAGKQAVTGTCECTSILGPLLGGGHGVLQGEHGLLIDNLVSARLILANGSAVTVSSSSHPDLFWALRGAGHNFGIVTEIEYKIYDVEEGDSWMYESFVFKGSQVDGLYGLENELEADEVRRSRVFMFSFWAWSLEIDTDGPVIFFFVLYHGTASDAAPFFKHFDSLIPAIPVQSGTVTLPGIASLTGNGYDGLACGHGSASLRFPIDVKSYDVQAQRDVYEKFKEVTLQEPALRGSFFLFEGYPVKGVQDVPVESTAFPHRLDNLLISPVMVYTPNSTLDAIAIQAGKDLRQILHKATGREHMHSYVNYAHGDESLQEMYGFERWRLEKLRALKGLWDPKGKFGFYAPIK